LLYQSKPSFHSSLSLHDGECTVKILDHRASHEADVTAIARMSDSLISWDHSRFICFSSIESIKEIENTANASIEHTDQIDDP
jgi:hypothetical protein